MRIFLPAKYLDMHCVYMSSRSPALASSLQYARRVSAEALKNKMLAIRTRIRSESKEAIALEAICLMWVGPHYTCIIVNYIFFVQLL